MDEVMDRVEARFAAIFGARLEHPSEPPLAGIAPSAWAPDPWRDAPPERAST